MPHILPEPILFLFAHLGEVAIITLVAGVVVGALGARKIRSKLRSRRRD